MTLVVQVPTKLTSEQKATLEAFDRAMNGGAATAGADGSETSEGASKENTGSTGHKKKGFKEKLNDLFE